MKQIKFRVRDTISNKWYDFDDGHLDFENKSGIWIAKVALNDSFVIQMFTGFKDKNGKEIYDGDLIKGNGYGPYRVFWDECGGWCSCCYHDSELISSYKTIEVVGHIFDGTNYEGII